jgi:hypothetical protein
VILGLSKYGKQFVKIYELNNYLDEDNGKVYAIHLKYRE